jgi:tRNA-(ms[2]io[6]A)-hydroxylase
LADNYLPKQWVRKRWKEWIDYEKQLMQSMEIRGDRIH